MGKGLSTLQRDLLALANMRRKSPPVTWHVAGSAPIPEPLAEHAAERGRALYDEFRRLFDPTPGERVEAVTAPGRDVNALDVYWWAWDAIKQSPKDVTITDPQWLDIARMANLPAHALCGSAEDVWGIAVGLIFISVKGATGLDGVSFRTLDRRYEVGAPIRFLSLEAAEAYAAELRARVPVIDWATKYSVPNALAWHVRVADALDALYGCDRDAAAENRARVAVSRSIERLAARGYVVTSVGRDKQAGAGASYSLTWDGWAHLRNFDSR